LIDDLLAVKRCPDCNKPAAADTKLERFLVNWGSISANIFGEVSDD